MLREAPIRLAIFLLLGASWQTEAQVVGMPQPKPSAAISPATPIPNSAVTAPAPQTPAQQPSRRAEVTYEQGKLAIKADNSSLNQILREIGRQTGIKITGGVADERVFGKYGPSSSSEVLASLLDGTGSNVLLIQSDTTSPGELILTPRHGGPTPPNPNAQGFDDDQSESNAVPQPQPPAPQPDPAQATPPPTGTPATPAANQPGSAPADPNAIDPNGVKTPQQIFQQLQKMRQQPTQ